MPIPARADLFLNRHTGIIGNLLAQAGQGH